LTGNTMTFDLSPKASRTGGLQVRSWHPSVTAVRYYSARSIHLALRPPGAVSLGMGGGNRDGDQCR
jgi:hypothetical protein